MGGFDRSFSDIRHMPALNLHQLDQRTVAIEFPVATEFRVVRGHGRIVAGDETGAVALHVAVQEFAEDFEFVFDVQRFTGKIDHGDRFACDYTITLTDAYLPPLTRAA